MAWISEPSRLVLSLLNKNAMELHASIDTAMNSLAILSSQGFDIAEALEFLDNVTTPAKDVYAERHIGAEMDIMMYRVCDQPLWRNEKKSESSGPVAQIFD